MTNWDELISGDELEEEAKERRKDYIEMKVSGKSIHDYQTKNWEIVKEYKNGAALMRKPKDIGDSFEDEVWTIFNKMGFKIMNKSRVFKLDCSPTNSKQIDVIAIDDEVCLLIECKETATKDNSKTWKTDLESINGNKGGLFAEVRKKYPNRKCKYIFATKNYVIGTADEGRMNDYDIANLDYESVLYYSNLTNHLKSAARYQLLGNLFAGQKIEGIQNKVPAIEGKMGGIKYYTFSIEPEKLLKLAFVLHRNKANHRMMPTYQRIINKKRLADIRSFVNEGGYFPNSIILSIDMANQLRFDRSSLQVNGSLSKIGVLHLPQTYRSAYVIDGQHRLYGYSDSKYAASNTVPVVAFIGLEQREQLKMFMDINENQKAVSKALRNTLNISMLWDSKDPNERLVALKLDIGQLLGEEPASPLYGRVVTGEDTATDKRCITLEYIKSAFDKSKFFNEYKRNGELKSFGTFDKVDNEKTEDYFFDFIKKYFAYIENKCKTEWEKGSLGYLTINNTTYGLIAILDDVVNIVLKNNGESVVFNSTICFESCKIYFDSLCYALNNLKQDDIDKIKTAKGGAAKKIAYRTLQVALKDTNSNFTNDDIEDYIKNELTDYKSDVEEHIVIVENYLFEKFKDVIKSYDNWFEELLPDEIKDELVGEVAKKKYKGEDVTELDLLDVSDLSKILTYKDNWSKTFQDIYSSDVKIKKQTMMMNIKEIETLKNKVSTSKLSTKSDYDKIIKVVESYHIDMENL